METLHILVLLLGFSQATKYHGENQGILIKPRGEYHTRPLGTSMVFWCSAYGLAPQVDAKLQWKDGEGNTISATTGRVYIERDGLQVVKLYIISITGSEAGSYTCTGVSNGKTLTETVSLLLYQDITFTYAPRVQHNKLYTDALIKCRVIGSPTPTVSWYHQGNKIEDAGRYSYESEDLRIQNITEADGGRYVCRAEVAADGRVKDQEIDVVLVSDTQYHAKILIQPLDEYHSRPLGSSIVFTCGTYGLAPQVDASLQWKDGEGNTISATTGRMSIEREGLQRVKLYIISINPGDAGSFSCTGVINGKTVTETVYLLLYKDITFDIAPHMQYHEIYTDAIISCQVSGRPLPTVSWYHQGNKIEDAGRYSYEDEGLHIQNITEADGGRYVCRAEVTADGRVREQQIDVRVDIPSSRNGE